MSGVDRSGRIIYEFEFQLFFPKVLLWKSQNYETFYISHISYIYM